MKWIEWESTRRQLARAMAECEEKAAGPLEAVNVALQAAHALKKAAGREYDMGGGDILVAWFGDDIEMPTLYYRRVDHGNTGPLDLHRLVAMAIVLRFYEKWVAGGDPPPPSGPFPATLLATATGRVRETLATIRL